MTADVVFTEEGGLGIITLNRPKALNALTLEMVMAMTEQLNLWIHQDNIAEVLIRAIPGKVFCAGGDVRWLYEQGLRKNPALMDFFTAEYALNKLIYHYPKPYAARIDGLNFGGGIGVTLHGRYRIATEQSVFAMPETAIGFFPDVGASHLLSRLGAIGMYLGLTGDKIGARAAKKLGLIDMIEPCDGDDYSGINITNQDEIENCFSGLGVPAIIENLKNQQTEQSQKILQNLALKSPMSLMVTYEQLTRAKSLDLDECLSMDAVLAKHFMQANDFYEGVRAMLIDKDKSPRWQPDTLNKISPKMVESYFK